MSNYTITKVGAEWMANKLCSGSDTTDLDVMYVLYSNGSTDHIDLDNTFSTHTLSELPSDVNYIRKKGGLIRYVNTSNEGTVEAVVSGVISDNVSDSDTDITRPNLSSSTSKIIAVAVGYSDKTGNDIIVYASNLSITDSVKWVSNMKMSVSCPITVRPYPETSVK